MSYYRRRSSGLFGGLARVVLVLVILGMLLGPAATPLVAELVRVLGDAVVALTQEVSQ